MVKRHALTWFSVVLVVLGWGCSTEVDLNAPYEERTLAFCLLDPAADEQWVRVNRTWLGEGNNLLFAQEADSSEYAPGAVTVTVEGFDSDDTGYQSAVGDVHRPGHGAPGQG